MESALVGELLTEAGGVTSRGGELIPRRGGELVISVVSHSAPGIPDGEHSKGGAEIGVDGGGDMGSVEISGRSCM